MDMDMLCIFVLAIVSSLDKVYCAQCDATFYDPVSDCSSHPLRVGYYPSPICGSLHTLTDADGRRYAEFARLGYDTGTDKYYHEYSAGRYLSIKLTKRARIYGIAVEGSPRNLRYYLKSMEIWYKVSFNNFSALSGSSTFESFYKESGMKKRFIANMVNQTKFVFAEPFFADEVRIYPISFHGDKVFRVELYGCYLGRVTIPSPIGVNNPAKISIDRSQDSSLQDYSYYVSVTEPNGTVVTMAVNKTLNYTFVSHGKGNMELGLNYSAGWLSTDKLGTVVQGPIDGLQMTLDASTVSPFTKKEAIDIEFYLGTSFQPYQIIRYHFSFGDGSSLTYNYCKHRYNRGIYTAVATASNDFFSANVTRSLVICPALSPSVQYEPYSGSAFRFMFIGSSAVYNISVTFYALHSTAFKLFLNSSEILNGNVSAVGNIVKQISLANPVKAPSRQYLRFQYNDACRTYDSGLRSVFVDERVAGISLQLNQTLKYSLIDQVPYYFKNYPIDFYVNVENGTSVSCVVNTDLHASAISTSVVVADRKFRGTRTYSSGGSSMISFNARCSNRLLLGAASPAIAVELREIPETMTNFSLELSAKVVRVGELFHLLIIFTKGNEMSCNITSLTGGISLSYTYAQLIARQQGHRSGGKAYKILMQTNAFSLDHQINVTCRSVLNEVQGSVRLQAQEPVSGLALNLPTILCHNETLNVTATTSQGQPIFRSLFINSTKLLEFYAIDGSSNVFLVPPSMYGEPGLKEVTVEAWNNVSTLERLARVRVAGNVTAVSVLVNFTISSDQGLERRPINLLPVRERIDFTANVVPSVDGFVYSWSINGNLSNASTTTPHWNYTFISAGAYLLTLVVSGCDSFVYQRYYTVLEPVEDFQVNVQPYPVVLVSSSFSVNVTIPSNSDCMVAYLGRTNMTFTRCRNDSLGGLFCNFSSAMCYEMMSFGLSGSYSLNFTASNGLYARFKTLNITAKSCNNPKISLQGNGTDPNAVKQRQHVYRSNSLIYQVTLMNISCELSSSYAIYWTVYSPWYGSHSKHLVSNSNFEFESSNRTLKVPCCILSYGEFAVEAKVQMVGHDLINGLFSVTKLLVAHVNDTNVVAMLKGNSANDSYAYNTTISLSAEESYDPDNFTQNLRFTWYCRDTTLEARDIFSIPNIPVINSTYLIFQKISSFRSLNASLSINSVASINESTSRDGSAKTFADNTTSNAIIGCFGKPFGRLDVANTTRSITFNSANVQENHTIEFVVVVEGATPLRLRRSISRRNVFVRLRETPYFEIRCVDNCASKVVPTEKLTLRIICKSESCEKRANFIWSMNENGHHVSLADKIHSQPTEKDLYMKPNVLSKGSHYRLTLRGIAYDGAVFERIFLFTVNRPPEHGNCSISPLSGSAIQTNFIVNCTGWADSEQPILYEVAHFTSALMTIICKKTQSFCNTILPVGHGSNSSLNVRVRVMDALSMFTEFYFVVKVTAGKLSLFEMEKYLGEIRNGTDKEKTLQLISAVTSVLNAYTDPNTTDEYQQKSIELREASVLSLAKMVNISTLETVAPITAAVADMPSQFSQKSGNVATNALVQMTEIFWGNQLEYIFRDIVDHGKNLLAAIGMVSKSTALNLDPKKVKGNSTNTTEKDYLLWTKDVGRKLILNNSVAFDNITSTMLSRMSAYDGDISLLTSDLSLILRKSLSTDLNSTSRLSVMNNKVVIPSLGSMNIGDDSPDVYGILMKATTFNSYFWGASSNRISTMVTDLEFRTGNTPLTVKNTKEPIRLQIKRHMKKPILFQHWRFQQRANQERVNYHKFDINYDSSLHLELKPMNYCIDYNIYIKHGSRPSRYNYYKTWTLPDLSTCNGTGLQEDIRANICAIYKEVVEPSLQLQINGSQQHINCSLMAVLQNRIGDALMPCQSDPYKIYLLDSETKNGPYYVGIYEADRRIFQETVPALLYNSSHDCQIADVVAQSSYYIRGYTSKCRYWAPSQGEQWLSQGCFVGKETDPNTVHCNCNHMTSFAADFFVAPNPIDIDKVIEGFKNIEDNVSVLILISLLSALYIMLVVYLRRKDKRDSEKVNITVVDNDSAKPYEYLVIFVTGARINAGSTAHVFCCLNSASKLGEPKLLFDSERCTFQRDQIDAFKVSFSESLGDIMDIRLWHDNAGDSPGWYLSRIYVEDLQTNRRFSFICEQWLAVELGDCLIDRLIPAAGYDDQKHFTHLFTTKAAKDLSDQHLWLSVGLKRAHDTFTRVQRLTCCMSLLFTTMLASAMFFQLGNDSKYLWKIGSLVIDYKGIVIGIQSGLVVIPVNFIIAWIFRHTESFRHYRKRREDIKFGRIASRKLLLPCGFLVIAWFLAVASILASLVVILFYSMQWGNERSQQFVLSVFTSFIQSAFVIQPVKLVLVAMVLAIIFKRADDETDILDAFKYSAEEKEVSNVEIDIDMSKLQTSPLTEDQLEQARKRRNMEIRLKLFLQDLLSYCVFLIFLVLVVRGYRDPDEYNFRKALEDDIVHQHFHFIQDVPGIWTWAQHHFIPAIYSQQWYNGENFTNFKMLRNQEAYRIGLARIRQVRIKPGSCIVWQEVARHFNTCDDFYSLARNENGDFDIAWKPMISSRKRRSVVDEYTAGVQKLSVLFQNDTMKQVPLGSANVEYNPWGMQKESSVGYNLEPRLDSMVLGTEDSGLKFEKQQAYIADHLYESEVVQKRSRRALKFKIKRKTIRTPSAFKHSDVVSIDEQYLLPNGQVRSNKEHWLYNDMSKLRGFPYYGHFATYSGGGYVASLSTDIDFARATAMALEQDSWIDMLTRAVFFEFSVYNANMNFFATGFVMIEILPTGSVVPNANIRVFKLYRYVGAFGRLVMASEIILVLCLFFFIYKECRHMYRLGCSYFKLFWSWVEITIAIALFTALILRGFSWYEGDKNLIALRQNMGQFINFHYTVIADDALLVSITIISFASTLKIIKLLSIFPTFVCLKETISRFAWPLLNYTLPFFIAFFGFASLSSLLFRTELLFSSYGNSCQTQFLMLVGGSVYYTLQQAHATLGPLFFFMFAAFETCVLLNIFLTIINDSIKESSYWKTKAKSTEFVYFVEDRIRAIFNLKPAGRGADKGTKGSINNYRGTCKETNGSTSQNRGNGRETNGSINQNRGNGRETNGSTNQNWGNGRETNGSTSQNWGNGRETNGSISQNRGNGRETNGSINQNRGNGRETNGSISQNGGTDKERNRSINQRVGIPKQKPITKPASSNESSKNRKLLVSEPIVRTSLNRKVAFGGDRRIPQTSIRKSSILNLLDRKRKSEARKQSYVVCKEVAPTAVIVVNEVSPDGEISSDIARAPHKSEMELLMEDLRAKRQSDKMIEQWKLAIGRLEDFIECSMEDDLNDLKTDLMIYCRCLGNC